MMLFAKISQTLKRFKLLLRYPLEVYFQLQQRELDRLDLYCRQSNQDWADTIAIAVEQALNNLNLERTPEKQAGSGSVFLLIALAGDERHYIDIFRLTQQSTQALIKSSGKTVAQEIRRELLRLVL